MDKWIYQSVTLVHDDDPKKYGRGCGLMTISCASCDLFSQVNITYDSAKEELLRLAKRLNKRPVMGRGDSNDFTYFYLSGCFK